MSGKTNPVHHCPACGKVFYRRDVFRCHMRIHRNEKPYGCSYCGKTFAHPGNRNQHVASHQERKLFKCEFCDKHFSLKIFRNRHTKNVHPEKYVPSHIGHVERNRRGNKSVFKLNQYCQDMMNEQQTQSENFTVPQNKTILKSLLSHAPGSMESLLPGSQSSEDVLFFGQSTTSETMATSFPSNGHVIPKTTGIQSATDSSSGGNVYIPQTLPIPLMVPDDQLKCHLCPMTFDKRHKYQLHIMMHELNQNEPVLDENTTDCPQNNQEYSHSENDDGKKVVYVVPKFKGFSKEEMQTVQLIYSKTAENRRKTEQDKYPEPANYSEPTKCPEPTIYTEVKFIKQEVID